MTPPEQPQLRWIKAQKSMANGACVELARSREEILLRNSRRPEILNSFTRAEIDAFLHGAKRGEFDHLLDD